MVSRICDKPSNFHVQILNTDLPIIGISYGSFADSQLLPAILKRFGPLMWLLLQIVEIKKWHQDFTICSRCLMTVSMYCANYASAEQKVDAQKSIINKYLENEWTLRSLVNRVARHQTNLQRSMYRLRFIKLLSIGMILQQPKHYRRFQIPWCL